MLLKLEAVAGRAHREGARAEGRRRAAHADEEQADGPRAAARPHLLERILATSTACGVVGEETNKLVGYLAAVSPQARRPLAVVDPVHSAAGKSSLMEAVLAFVPDGGAGEVLGHDRPEPLLHGRDRTSSTSPGHRRGGGRERASYALKLLQSEGELTIASTGKDPQTGKLVTQEYRVEGPVMLFLTTTAIELDEELLNRCLVLTVDEGREQTRAIHRLPAREQTLEGLLARRGPRPRI